MKCFVTAITSLALLVAATANSARAQVYDRETALVRAVEKVMPSVVSIRTERSGNWGKKDGIGTGVIVDERGYAITNCHVIAGSSRVLVTLQDKTEVVCQVLVADPSNDLAILKLPAGHKITALPIGPGTDLKLCETVIAIGHPYGYTNTVTTGVISALGREIAMPNGEVLKNLTQHSACINPGNSGGPLVNINGELIGINVALREGAQGIAFALNADTVQKVLARHLSAKKMSRVTHGLVVHETVCKATGQARQRVVVETVAGDSPAAEAGLKSGDVIVKLSGRAVANRFDVERAFWTAKPGDKVEATVMRSGRETSLALTLIRGTEAVASATEETNPSSRSADVVQAASQR